MIRSELGAFADVASTSNRLRDSATHFLKMPHEVLEAIVEIIASSRQWEPKRYCCSRSTSMDMSRSLGWLALGHVCHALRTVLLSYPGFWNRAINIFPADIYNHIPICTDRPLCFDIDALCEHDGPRIEFVAQNLLRAKQLRILHHEGTADSTPLLPKALSGLYLPNLEILDVRFQSSPSHPSTGTLLSRGSLDSTK